MNDPFQVRDLGDLRVTCQIICMGHRDGATLIDLVTLEACDRGGHELPAGTPFTIGFEATYEHEDRLALESVVDGWESGDSVLVLDIADGSSGICYQFSDGEEHLLLVVDEKPPEPDRWLGGGWC